MQTQNLPLTRSVLKWSLIALVPMLLLSAWASTRLPEGARIPVHWNAAGEIDRYGSRFEGLWLMPIISAGLAVLLAALPLWEPRQRHLLQSSRAYILAGTGVLLFLLCLHGAIVLTALGRPVSVPRVVFGATGVLFVVMGSSFGSIRSNHFFGLRTPWTLSSERSWNKTHRLGGRLFMLLGLAVFGCGWAPSESLGLWVLLGGLLAVVLVSTVYSYRVWKADPARRHNVADDLT